MRKMLKRDLMQLNLFFLVITTGGHRKKPKSNSTNFKIQNFGNH